MARAHQKPLRTKNSNLHAPTTLRSTLRALHTKTRFTLNSASDWSNAKAPKTRDSGEVARGAGTRDKQWEKASGIFEEHAPFRITDILQWNFVDAMLCHAASHALLPAHVPPFFMPIMIFFITPAKEKARLHACVESFHFAASAISKGRRCTRSQSRSKFAPATCSK
jgi:hypothetical protein